MASHKSPAMAVSKGAEILPFMPRKHPAQVATRQKGMHLNHVTERDGTHTVTMTFAGLNESDVVRFSAWISGVMDEAAMLTEDDA